MPKANYRGIVVPQAGDDLLGGLETMAGSTLAFTRTQNSESANLLAAQAQAAGANVSAANPMLFLTSVFNQYAHDGQTLHSLNMPTYAENTYAGDAQYSRINAGTTRTVITSSLTAAPFDRLALAWGTLDADIGEGNDPVPGYMWLRLSAVGQASASYARLDETMYQNHSTFDMFTIPADTNPNVQLQLRNPSAVGMDVKLSSVANSNRLMVVAFPINMSGQ